MRRQSNLGNDPARSGRHPERGRRLAVAALAASMLACAPAAHASFLPPEMMDTAAMGLAWFVVCFVPIGAIALFWGPALARLYLPY